MLQEDYDDVEQFIFIAEQLKLCHELIETGRTARERAALILLDHLADVLVYRRCSLLFLTIDSDPYARTFLPRFDQAQRKQAERNFETRLEIAMKYDDHGQPDPMFGEREKAVLLIVHRYRNLAYHRDTHNPRTVGLLARIALWVVSEAWFESYKDGGDTWEPGIGDRLRELGTAVFSGDNLNARGNAWLLRKTLGAVAPPEAKEVGAILASDLEDRVSGVYVDARLVPDGFRELDAMIEHYRFWAIARSDDRVVELRRKVDWSRRLVEDGPDAQGQHDRYLRESEQTMPLYNARLQELKNSLGLRPATRILAEARASAHEFVREVPLDVMLTRYRRLDEELAKVEEAAAEALEQHEKWVDIEIEDRKLRDMGAYD